MALGPGSEMGPGHAYQRSSFATACFLARSSISLAIRGGWHSVITKSGRTDDILLIGCTGTAGFLSNASYDVDLSASSNRICAYKGLYILLLFAYTGKTQSERIVLITWTLTKRMRSVALSMASSKPMTGRGRSLTSRCFNASGASVNSHGPTNCIPAPCILDSNTRLG